MSKEEDPRKLVVREDAGPTAKVGQLFFKSADKERYTFNIDPDDIFEIVRDDDGVYYVGVKLRGAELIPTEKEHNVTITMTDEVSGKEKKKVFRIRVKFKDLPEYFLVPGDPNDLGTVTKQDWRQWLAIIGLSILACLIYSFVILATRLRIEKTFEAGDPNNYRSGWSVLAIWLGVGIVLGVLLAALARLGSRRKLSAVNLIRPVVILVLCNVLLVYISVARGDTSQHTSASQSAENWKRLIQTVGGYQWLDITSYVGWVVGGMILMVWVWFWGRRKENGTVVANSGDA